MNCNRRARTTAERIMCQYEAHLGPVHGLHRHPQLPKIFLTVGDWTTHVWTEDIRDSPILTLKFVYFVLHCRISDTLPSWLGIKMSNCWPEPGVILARPSYSLQPQMAPFTCGTF